MNFRNQLQEVELAATRFWVDADHRANIERINASIGGHFDLPAFRRMKQAEAEAAVAKGIVQQARLRRWQLQGRRIQ